MQQIIDWLKQDPIRMRALECVFQLNLSQCYIAAGFVRNLVWDHLHDKPELSPLNDVDVIYFDQDEQDDQAYLMYEARLKTMMPELNWQVRNQARMHIRNGDRPYKSSVDAMSYWPEKETAVAVRKSLHGQLECMSAFGFTSLLNLQLTYNPKREKGIFDTRMKSKQWLKKWANLIVR